jgi:hypothetical protein
MPPSPNRTTARIPQQRIFKMINQNNTKTIIPAPAKELAPLSLVILEFLDAEAEERETDMFERLHIENAINGFTTQKVHSRAKIA